MALFRAVQTQFSPDSCSTNRSGQQVPHAHEVVSRRREGKHPPNFEDSAVPHFPHQRNGLEPAEALFNARSRMPLTAHGGRCPEVPTEVVGQAREKGGHAQKPVGKS